MTHEERSIRIASARAHWPQSSPLDFVIKRPRVAALTGVVAIFLIGLAIPSYVTLALALALLVVLINLRMRQSRLDSAARSAIDHYEHGQFDAAATVYEDTLPLSRFQPINRALLALGLAASYSRLGETEIALVLFNVIDRTNCLSPKQRRLLHRHHLACLFERGDLDVAKAMRDRLGGDGTAFDILLLARLGRFSDAAKGIEHGFFKGGIDEPRVTAISLYAREQLQRQRALWEAFVWHEIANARGEPPRGVDPEARRRAALEVVHGIDRHYARQFTSTWPELRVFVTSTLG